MQNILYVSRALQPFNLRQLLGLMDRVRVLNEGEGVTGALFYHDALFLQLIEGPKEIIDTTWKRIADDTRHEGLIIMARNRATNKRIFPDWRMGFFHLSSIEPLVEGGLIANQVNDMTALLAAADPTDPSVILLKSFWLENRQNYVR